MDELVELVANGLTNSFFDSRSGFILIPSKRWVSSGELLTISENKQK